MESLSFHTSAHIITFLPSCSVYTVGHINTASIRRYANIKKSYDIPFEVFLFFLCENFFTTFSKNTQDETSGDIKKLFNGAVVENGCEVLL